MASIRETVRQAMTDQQISQYGQYAEPVIVALENRERDIFTGLLDAGQSFGLERSQTRAVLEDLHLTPPVAVVVQSNGHSLSTDERDELASVRHDLSTLMERIDKVLG